MPRPPPPIACISVRSRTTTWASVCDVTASRSLRALSVGQICPRTQRSPSHRLCRHLHLASYLRRFLVVVFRARTLPFLNFVQDEKGNFRRGNGSSYAERENLPYRKCCTTVFVVRGTVGTVFQEKWLAGRPKQRDTRSPHPMFAEVV